MIFTFFAAAAGASGVQAACTPEGAEIATVSSVLDQRTVVLADGRHLALAGIGAFPLPSHGPPESRDDPATERLRHGIVGRQVAVVGETDDADRYGRRPAYVFADGELVQARLARQGLVMFVPPSARADCASVILSAEARARMLQRGWWADPIAGVQPASPDALAPHIGRFAIIEGQVVSVGTRRNRTYLDFGARWVEDFTVEIARQDRGFFGGTAALERLTGSTVRVRGLLQSQGGPMIEARWPGQIEIVARPPVADQAQKP